MELRQQLLSSALFALQTNGVTRLFIDVTSSTFAPAESMTDAFQVTTYMRSLGFTPNTRIAFLQQGNDLRRSFSENAAQAAGELWRKSSIIPGQPCSDKPSELKPSGGKS